MRSLLAKNKVGLYFYANPDCMNAFLTLTLITRTKEDEHNEKVMHYLRKGYTIEATQKLESLQDGTVTMRYKLRKDEIVVTKSRFS